MISFRLYREYGALNSRPIFDAFEQAVKKSGHTIVNSNEDVSVIWSVLWKGRMRPNLLVYQRCRQEKRPVVIIEVGNLKRGETWRISLYNVNREGVFANERDMDTGRRQKLNIDLNPKNINRKSSILITTQHDQSLQWQGQPQLGVWLDNIITQIRKFSNRDIVVRPHPRCPLNFLSKIKNIKIDTPKKLDNTYDDYNIDFDHHCVINHNSGPTVQSAIAGTPIICHSSGLAYDVSDSFENIEDIQLIDREDWFLKLCHTEWTVDEITKGIPLQRLLPQIILDLEKK
jgi:hypothetical protein